MKIWEAENEVKLIYNCNYWYILTVACYIDTLFKKNRVLNSSATGQKKNVQPIKHPATLLHSISFLTDVVTMSSICFLLRHWRVHTKIKQSESNRW